MIHRRPAALCLVLIAAGLACDHDDKQRAEMAADKARANARQLARKAEREGRRLKDNVSNAVTQDANSTAAERAKEKLRNGADDLRNAGSEAARKLDRAALVAKIKAGLANDVGLKTVGGIRVDTDSSGVVTLSGIVSSPAQKAEAERSAAQVAGVTNVVNHLTVQ